MSNPQTSASPATPATDQFSLKKKEAKPQDILALLQSDSVRKKVEMALPKHMKPDRMLRVMLTAVSSNPKLRECSQTSLLSCLLKCSQVGLEPDGRHAHLIPFGKECTVIWDYKGLAQIVRRSGEVKNIHADVVYEGDEFAYHYGSGAMLRHKPTMDVKTRGKIIAAYSFVVMSTGEESFEVLPIDDVNDVRDNSQGYQAAKKYNKQSPWDSSYPEMAKKTAFRRHTKWLPFSAEIKEHVSADDDEETRFQNAKVVKPTDLGGEDSALIDFPADGGQPAAETTAEAKAPEKKPEPKAAPPAGNPRSALLARMTLEQVSESEVIEILVRKNKTTGASSLIELPDDVIAWALENADVIFAQIRIDRKGNQQPN